MKTEEIVYMGIELLVEGVYTPSEQEIGYYSDMSGHPGSPPEFYIEDVIVQDTSIIDLLSTEQLREIETLILEKICG